MTTATPTKGIEAISNAFSAAKKRGQATLIPYICGGFSNPVKMCWYTPRHAKRWS